MLEIHTIDAFEQLDTAQKEELQKALKVKKRLEAYLLNKAKGADFDPYDVACSHCKGGLHHKQPRDRTGIHPSSIDRCIKTIWYSAADWWRQEPYYTIQGVNKHDAKMQLLYDWGTALHDTLQGYGKDGAWGDPNDYHNELSIYPGIPEQPNTELPFASELWIKGHIDALVDNYIVEQVPTLGDVSVRLIHEYKSMVQYEYDKLNSPKREHKWQAMIYAAVYNVPIVVYLYVGKNNSAMSDYPVGFDHLLWQHIHDKILRVQELVQKWTLPPWKETSAGNEDNGQECKGCRYLGLCKPPHPKKVKIVTPKVPTIYKSKKRRFR